MASLKDLVYDNIDSITDGIEWVAIYKTGRSWNLTCFFVTDGSYDTGYSVSSEDAKELCSIIQIDPHAIIVNGYYCGYPEDDGCSSKTSLIQEALERTQYLYANQGCNLENFIKNTTVSI